MKGLAALPSTQDLQSSYAILQSPDCAPTIEQIALWSQWARLDPRLAEIWIQVMSEKWQTWAPLPLSKALQIQPWPAAAGPLLEHVKIFKVERAHRKAFGHWMDCVMAPAQPAPGELFFIGVHAFAGKSSVHEAEHATQPFARWGYAGTSPLINKAAQTLKKGRHTLLSKERRLALLSRLLRGRSRITVNEYVEALQGQVSRRTAELDLASMPGLRRHGNTRATIYRKKT